MPLYNLLTELADIFDSVLRQQEYVKFEDPGERHGSLETTWVLRDKQSISRYITLAITEENAGEIPSLPRIEIWIGVDDHTSYVRQLVSSFLLWFWPPPSSEFKHVLQEKAEHALNRVNSLSTGDLTESYAYLTPVAKVPKRIQECDEPGRE
ncbi:MAG: hypothetical protein HYY96_01240 [Candidatus Tectomicrobia bacterium]|nr:hypothetical protein [Candidatus Tectomicrobia bacterium]